MSARCLTCGTELELAEIDAGRECRECQQQGEPRLRASRQRMVAEVVIARCSVCHAPVGAGEEVCSRMHLAGQAYLPLVA